MIAEKSNPTRKKLAVVGYICLAVSIVVHVATLAGTNLASGNSLNVIMFAVLGVFFFSVILFYVRSFSAMKKMSKEEYKLARKGPLPFLSNVFFFNYFYVFFVVAGPSGEFVERDGEVRYQKHDGLVYQTYSDEASYLAEKTVGELQQTRLYSATWLLFCSVLLIFLIPRDTKALEHQEVQPDE